jgi:drug/metabolite transporter (DMT)-like permease
VRRLVPALVLALTPAVAWADHGAGLRAEGWSPLVTALVFGGLAFVTGIIVVIIVAVLTRGESRSEP